MVLHKTADGPVTCSDWDDLCTTFLGEGRNRYACTYMVFTDGLYYYAQNGSTGAIDFGGPLNNGVVDGTDATDVIHAAWGAMTDGGRICCIGDFDLGIKPLTFSLTKYQTSLELVGAGETKTTFTYAGAGFAMTFTTADAAVGYYYLRLQGFYLDCTAKTAGRHGIRINDIGRAVVVEHIKVYNTDVAIRIEDDANEVYLYNVRVVDANTGIHTTPDKCNEIRLVNCQIIGTTTYGVHFDGGNSMALYGCAISPTSGIGLYTDVTWTLNIDGCYFHSRGTAYTCDAKITGTNAAFPSEAVTFKNCYFNGLNDSNHAIELEWVDTITIDTCKSRNHVNAFIYLYNHTHNIVIVNPNFDETYLFDSELLTQAESRFAGTVIEARRVGFIAVNADADACDEGDVMVPSGTGIYVHTTTLNDDNPSVVMYGQLQNKPIVLCMKGITPVEMEAAVTLDDTIVASNTNTMGETNNAQTDPKKVIGYCAQGTIGAGLALTRIL